MSNSPAPIPPRWSGRWEAGLQTLASTGARQVTQLSVRKQQPNTDSQWQGSGRVQKTTGAEVSVRAGQPSEAERDGVGWAFIHPCCRNKTPRTGGLKQQTLISHCSGG